MRFNIHTGNHNSHHGIGDTVLFLKNALQDCGHQASISHWIEPDQINIVLEHFTEEAHILPLIQARGRGTRFILIGTEPIENGTFNHSIDIHHEHYGKRDYWKLRFDSFAVAAGLADAIWVLAESMVPGYAALFPNLPVRFLPHGYVNNFATVVPRPEVDRDIDFYFSGALTNHRKKILGDLNRTHRVWVADATVPEYLRQDMLSRSKVSLSLRLSAHNRIPSVSRIHHHLQNRSFLLQEAYDLPCELDPFVLQAATADFAEWARAALDIPNRREVADGAYERFRAALPMSLLLAPLLDEATGRNDMVGRGPLISQHTASRRKPDSPMPIPDAAVSSAPSSSSSWEQADSVIAQAGLNAIQFELSARQREKAADAMANMVNTLMPPSRKVADSAEIKSLRDLGVLSLGQALTPTQAAEAVEYFSRTPCFDTHVPTYSDGIARKLQEAAQHSVYGSYKLREALMAPHLFELALNPEVLAVCERYLGCLPTIYSVHVWWTFAGHGQPGRTHGFHRDQDDHRFLSLFTYLTDVPEGEGQIEFLAGTHRLDFVQEAISAHAKKNRLEQTVDAERFFPQYSANGYDDEPGKVPIPYSELFQDHGLSLTGKAGSAFIADTFALHRGTPPGRHHRLACWIRYGLAKHPVFVLDRTEPVPASMLGARMPQTREAEWATRLIIDRAC